MQFYRKDPIVELILSNLENSKVDLELKTIDDLREMVNNFNKNGKKINSLSILIYMVKKFNNDWRSKFDLIDCLIGLGFYFDAEKKAEDYFYKVSKHVLLLARLVSIKIKKREYADVVALCLENKELLIKHKGVFSSFLDTLRVMNNYSLYNYFLEKYNEIFSENKQKFNTNSIKYTLNDLYIAYFNNDQKAHNISWVLYNNGERSLEFFKIVTKNFYGERDGSARLSFFRNEAIKNFPDCMDFFYLGISQKIFLSFFEEAYYLFHSKNVRDIVLNISINEDIRLKIYNLHLKLSILVEHKDYTLLNLKEAERVNLLQPYILDLRRLLSFSIINNNDNLRDKCILLVSELDHEVQLNFRKISEVIKNNLKNYNESLATTKMVVSGQFRGGDKSRRSLNEFYKKTNSSELHLYTWDTQPITPPRFNLIGRLFNEECINLIPVEYRNTEFFHKKFPLFLKSIFSAKNMNLSEKYFCFENKDSINIYSEKDFESTYGQKQDFICFGKLNQSKMFFMKNEAAKYEYKAKSIVNMRPDLNIKFNFELDDYIDITKNNMNILYINYFSAHGAIGDQFSIGDVLSFANLNSLFHFSVEDNRLVYASYFESLANLGGEVLLTNQAVAMAVNVRYIYSDAYTFNNIDHFMMIDYEESLEKDFNNLDNKDKNNLRDFYLYLKNYKK